MAMAFGAIVNNGVNYKAFTVTSPNVDAHADSLAVDFTANGMTDLPGTPTSYGVLLLAGADNEVAQAYSITAVAATGMTVNKVTPTVALSANTNTVQVWARFDRGVMR